jgi:hypothetical protein
MAIAQQHPQPPPWATARGVETGGAMGMMGQLPDGHHDPSIYDPAQAPPLPKNGKGDDDEAQTTSTVSFWPLLCPRWLVYSMGMGMGVSEEGRKGGNRRGSGCSEVFTAICGT